MRTLVVHIGMPRCGSTAIRKAVAAHPGTDSVSLPRDPSSGLALSPTEAAEALSPARMDWGAGGAYGAAELDRIRNAPGDVVVACCKHLHLHRDPGAFMGSCGVDRVAAFACVARQDRLAERIARDMARDLEASMGDAMEAARAYDSSYSFARGWMEAGAHVRCAPVDGRDLAAEFLSLCGLDGSGERENPSMPAQAAAFLYSAKGKWRGSALGWEAAAGEFGRMCQARRGWDPGFLTPKGWREGIAASFEAENARESAFLGEGAQALEASACEPQAETASWDLERLMGRMFEAAAERVGG